MNNISRKKLLILIAIFVIAALIIFFILLNDKGAQEGPGQGFEDEVGSEEYLIEEPGLPREEWKREINVEKETGKQTITNVYDGYKISVPEEWTISEEVRTGLQGLSFSVGQSQEALEDLEARRISHIDEGMIVSVFVYKNEQDLSLADWLKTRGREIGLFQDANFQRIQHSFYQIHKNTNPLMRDDWNGSEVIEVPIEDTLSVQYLIKDHNINTVYVINCTIYNDINIYAPMCDNIVPSFEILEP